MGRVDVIGPERASDPIATFGLHALAPHLELTTVEGVDGRNANHPGWTFDYLASGPRPLALEVTLLVDDQEQAEIEATVALFELWPTS